MSATRTVTVMIRGQVQAVGYRAWTEHHARRLNLAGWVRNRRDGSVEALFEGPVEVVAEMIRKCHRGPASARVDGVDESEATPDDAGLSQATERFSVLPTL